MIHDDLCRLNLSDCDHGNTRVCHCRLIARVRADERERIAQRVQAMTPDHAEGFNWLVQEEVVAVIRGG